MGSHKKVLLAVVLVFVGFLLSANLAFAAGLVPCGNDASNLCTTCDFFKLADNVKNFLMFKVVPPVGVLFVLIAGFFMLIGGAKPGNYERGKKILTDLVWGLLIIFGAWMLTNTALKLLAGKSDISSNWYKIECTATGITPGGPPGPGGSTFSCKASPSILSATQKNITYTITGGSKPPINCNWPDIMPQTGVSYVSKSGCTATIAYTDVKATYTHSIPVTDSSDPVKSGTATCKVGPQTAPPPPPPPGGGTNLTCNVQGLPKHPERCPDAGKCPDCKPITSHPGLFAAASLADLINNVIDPQFRAAGITYVITEAMCPKYRHSSCAHFNGHAIDISYNSGNLKNNLQKACQILNNAGLVGKSSETSADRGVYIMEKVAPGGACPSRICAGCGTASFHIQY